MAAIRPKDLPAADAVTGTGSIIVDSGSAVQKATPAQIVDAAAPVASQSEATTGTENTKRMTALRVKQAIDNRPAIENIATLAALKAADTAQPKHYDLATFTWTLGDYTGQADDTNIIKSDANDLSVGAWVRQAAANIRASDGNTVQANLDHGGYYTGTGTGTTDRTTKSRLDEEISLLNYDVSDGDEVSAELLQAVTDAAGRSVYIPHGTYYLDASISGDFSVNLRLDANTKLIKRHDTGYAISLYSPYTDIVTISSGSSAGSDTIVVADAANYAAGDDIRIVSADRLIGQRDAPGDGTDYYRGEAAVVKSVSGTTITLQTPLLDTYTTSPRVGRYPKVSLNIQGGIFEAEEGHDSDPWTYGMIRASGYPEVNVTTTISRSYGLGVGMLGAVRGIITVTGHEFTNDPSNGQYGYIIQPTGASNLYVTVDAGRCRHGFTTGGQPVASTATDLSLFGPVRGCNVGGVGSGNMESLIDFHHGSQDCIVRPSLMVGGGTTPDGGGAAYTIRGLRHTLIGPKARKPRVGLYVFTETSRISNVAVDGTKDIRIIDADISTAIGDVGTIDTAYALYVDTADLTLVGGRYSSSAFSTIKNYKGNIGIRGVVDIVPGNSESDSDRILDCTGTGSFTGPGKINIDASGSTTTAAGIDIALYIPSVAMDRVDVDYKSPSTGASNLFGGTSSGPVTNCNVKVVPNASVGLGSTMGNNSTARGMAVSDIATNSLSGNLTLTAWSSRTYLFSTTLTAARTVTLPSGSSQVDGDTWTFLRTASGAFDISIKDSGGTTIKTLSAPGGSTEGVTIKWCAATTSWIVTAVMSF